MAVLPLSIFFFDGAGPLGRILSDFFVPNSPGACSIVSCQISDKLEFRILTDVVLNLGEGVGGFELMEGSAAADGASRLVVGEGGTEL